jgi:hypothetical protein
LRAAERTPVSSVTASPGEDLIDRLEPGVDGSLTIDTAITLPVGVEACAPTR